MLPGDVDRIWLRDLPRSLQASPGVIELWLPPTEVMMSQNSPARDELAGVLNRTR